MIKFISQRNSKSLVLFVHGFLGDEQSWNSTDEISFPSLMLEDKQVADHFDIAHFTYFSKLSGTNTSIRNAIIAIRNLFPVTYEKASKNTSIGEIGSTLRTEIQFQLSDYDNIVVIAHSMGGLVAKSCILDEIKINNQSKVKMIVSLAVPHLGADLATIGNLISSNNQIGDLGPLKDFIQSLHGDWGKTNNTPQIKFFYGTSDSIVAKTSAAPHGTKETDIIAVDEDHTSISKPSGCHSTTFTAVKSIIQNYKTEDTALSELQFQTLTQDSEFDSELFVLKLIIADIHRTTIRDAKEMFLNAEYIRKRYNSESDQKRLDDLYVKIRKIYRDNFTLFQHGGIDNSGQLLGKVNQNILNEDRQFLLCKFMPFLNAIHKQGMLQQLANRDDTEVWWIKDGSIEDIQSYLDKDNEK